MKNTSKAKILIVDDDFINREILAHALREEYDIIVAEGGQQALQLARTEQPDLVLLDIIMDDVDGYEVCRALKTDSATKKLSIIFSTSKCTDEEEVYGLSVGASDYVTKPYNMALVRARVRNQILLKQKNDLLEQLASVDGLTEVPNRRYFDETSAQEWRRAMRSGYPISMCIVDIDCFKQYNDHYGHTVGDDCLVMVARELAKQSQRAGDFVARYGGEEFVFVWPNCPQEQAMLLADKARQAVMDLQLTHEYSAAAEVVTISSGLATAVPQQSTSAKSLLEAADEQLYRAKEQGRNRVFGVQL